MHQVGKNSPWLGKHPEVKFWTKIHKSRSGYLASALRQKKKLDENPHRYKDLSMLYQMANSYIADCREALVESEREIQYLIGFVHEKCPNVIFMKEWVALKKLDIKGRGL